jgi:hypothetical protein
MITSIKIRLNFERGSAFFVSSHLSNDILIILTLILISVSVAERAISSPKNETHITTLADILIRRISLTTTHPEEIIRIKKDYYTTSK